MAKFIYRTIGGVWAGFVDAMVAQVLTTPTASADFAISNLAVTFDSGIGLGLVTAENPGGDEFRVLNQSSFPWLEYGDLKRQPGMDKQIVCNFSDPGGGFVDFQEACRQATGHKGFLVAGASGGSFQFSFEGVTIGNTGSGVCLYLKTFGIASGTDVAIFVDGGVNNAYVDTVKGISTPTGVVYPTQEVTVFSEKGVTVNTSPPLDLEVGINAGQAILSVVSRTTTIIP